MPKKDQSKPRTKENANFEASFDPDGFMLPWLEEAEEQPTSQGSRLLVKKVSANEVKRDRAKKL